MTRMTVNGEPLEFRLDPQTPLLWALRDAANLTGAKYGCDGGACGACTVIVDGSAALSCALPIAGLEGAEIVTIEGLTGQAGTALREAWEAEQVSQCGYCEPGMIVALTALLQSNPRPTEPELEAIGNICRCGIGPRVLRAMRRASVPAGVRRASAQSERFSNGSSAAEQPSLSD